MTIENDVFFTRDDCHWGLAGPGIGLGCSSLCVGIVSRVLDTIIAHDD